MASADLCDCSRYGETADVCALLTTAGDGAKALADTPHGESGNYALHMASANGHTAVINALVEAGADVNVKNGAGSTPLHWAALNAHKAAVLALLSKGASPVAVNDADNTPFDEAKGRGHAGIADIIKHLIEKKFPEADAKAKAGATPADAAAQDKLATISPRFCIETGDTVAALSDGAWRQALVVDRPRDEPGMWALQFVETEKNVAVSKAMPRIHYKLIAPISFARTTV